MELTERQQRELAFHRGYAGRHAEILDQPLSFDVLQHPERRWWNAYWRMFEHILAMGIAGKCVLMVGCGFGEDALRLAKLGADVHAFDISPESLEIARARAWQTGLDVAFVEMAAESLTYPDGFFDVVLAHDILHHVDIPATMAELHRVSKPGATWIVNEIYSHTWTDRIRRARWVQRLVYPAVQRAIYGQDEPYITEDERKLTEHDTAIITAGLHVRHEEHFRFLVTRVLPDNWPLLTKADTRLLSVSRTFGRLMAGRVLLMATKR